jgi:acyl-coenzyme A synthetase/AMP-(fatty) acid ligase/acyl carrier protein
MEMDFSNTVPINAACHGLTLIDRLHEVCWDHTSLTAVLTDEEALTFGELDRRSERVAKALLKRVSNGAARVDEPSAYLLIDDFILTVVGAVGALKAGFAVAFADLEAPSEVHRKCVATAGLDFVLTTRQRINEVADGGFIPADVLEIGELLEGPDHPVDLPEPRPEQLAQLVFTSGSTGTPKCVERETRLIMHTWWSFHQILRPQPGERQLIVSPLHHVTGSYILLGSLLSGTTLCPYPLKELGTDPLPAWLADKRITHYRSGVTVYRSFMAAVRDPSVLAGLRTVFIGGEKVLLADIRNYQKFFAPNSLFITNFGSSECSSIAHWRITHTTDLSGDLIPAGFASPGKQIRLAGTGGREVPDGEVGEIVVKSRYIARGYRRDPELTARYFTFPESEPGVRIFRTGDFGRFLPDGRLECVGRRDAQVKVNGHRVECAGVESALLSLPGVELAAVIPLEVEPGNFRLTAFVKPVNIAAMSDPATHERNLRQHLQERVAAYAVPATIKIVEAMPLTRSGKIDRGLLEGELRDATNPSRAPARSGTESTLRDIWAEALGHKDFGVEDSFFGIGGNSLTAVRLINRVEESFGQRLKFRDIFDYPTVGEMAAYLDGAEGPDISR